MIERKPGEGLTHLGAAGDHRHLLGAEPVAQDVRQELAGGGGVFRGLEHHPAARRQGGGQGSHGEIDRVVPGRDDAALHSGQWAGEVRGDSVQDQAVAAWSLVHGLTMLLIDGRLSVTGLGGGTDRYARAVAAALVDGLKA